MDLYSYSARVELDAAALGANVLAFRQLLAPGTKIAAVVKGNAYGHGQAEVTKLLEDQVDFFQVDDVAEFRLVRTTSQKPTLVLGYVVEADLEELLVDGAILGVFDDEYLAQIDAAAKRCNLVARVHLEIDAELGRLGFLEAALPALLVRLAVFKNVKIEGLYAHFANIEDTSDRSHATKQIAIFDRACLLFGAAGYAQLTTHIAATSGVLGYERGDGHHHLVRLGIGLYGLWPSEDLAVSEPVARLKPVLRWVSQVAQVKQLPANWPIGYGLTYVTSRAAKVAVIPQGYSDGYDRGLSNSGEVLIGGQRCPVLGRVMMNMFVVDVSHVADVKRGDEVVLLGTQGHDRITAEELAQKLGTINYEITTRISPLLPRVIV